MTKTCANPECKETNPQPEENFAIEREGKYSWRRSRCKSCRRLNNNKYRKESQEKYNAYMREWNAANKHTRKFKDRYKNKVLKARYGITLEQYMEMYKAQEGKCAICQKNHRHENAMPVDHDHSSGKVRGLLCHSCNRSLHWFDSPEMSKRAQEYVAKYATVIKDPWTDQD